MINGKQKIKKDDWRTPDWLFNQLDNRFGFSVDAAATLHNKKTDMFFDDGLKQNWGGHRVFCNPPFSGKAEWLKKAHNEIGNGCPLCVMILPMCLDTKAFNEYVYKPNYHWEHLPYRVSFCDESGKPMPGNPSGTVIVYFWGKINRPSAG